MINRGPMMKRLVFSLALVIALAIPAYDLTAQNFGNWQIHTQKDYVGTSTLNDSGSLLGQYCYPGEGSCVWLLGVRTSCIQGDRYPALVNSEAGSAVVELYCAGPLTIAG